MVKQPDDIQGGPEKAGAFQRETPLRAGLRAVPETRQLLARELRAMAAAAGDDYRQFAYVARWIRNIWSAAADQIENQDAGRPKG